MTGSRSESSPSWSLWKSRGRTIVTPLIRTTAPDAVFVSICKVYCAATFWTEKLSVTNGCSSSSLLSSASRGRAGRVYVFGPKGIQVQTDPPQFVLITVGTDGTAFEGEAIPGIAHNETTTLKTHISAAGKQRTRGELTVKHVILLRMNGHRFFKTLI